MPEKRDFDDPRRATNSGQSSEETLADYGDDRFDSPDAFTQDQGDNVMPHPKNEWERLSPEERAEIAAQYHFTEQEISVFFSNQTAELLVEQGLRTMLALRKEEKRREEERKTGRNRLTALAVVVVIVLGALAVWYYWSSPATETEPDVPPTPVSAATAAETGVNQELIENLTQENDALAKKNRKLIKDKNVLTTKLDEAKRLQAQAETLYATGEERLATEKKAFEAEIIRKYTLALKRDRELLKQKWNNLQVQLEAAKKAAKVIPAVPPSAPAQAMPTMSNHQSVMLVFPGAEKPTQQVLVRTDPLVHVPAVQAVCR